MSTDKPTTQLGELTEHNKEQRKLRLSEEEAKEQRHHMAMEMRQKYGETSGWPWSDKNKVTPHSLAREYNVDVEEVKLILGLKSSMAQ